MSSDRELGFMSASALLDAYRRKTLSPVEATRAALARIERLEPKLNAFVLVDAEGALAAARESEARWAKGTPKGLVDGVPTTIKDIVLTKGWPTLRGSLLTKRDQAWNEDAPAVARLREHGAVLLGKTTTPENGWKALGDSPLTGITRNPWDLARTPGGSSAGAAAALAAGIGALAIGTDGGGRSRLRLAARRLHRAVDLGRRPGDGEDDAGRAPGDGSGLRRRHRDRLEMVGGRLSRRRCDAHRARPVHGRLP